MDENLELYTVYRRVISFSWLIMFSVSIILILISFLFFPSELWYRLSLSYLLGAMTNLFAFNLLKNNVSQISSNVKSAISSTFSNYIIRLMIYAFVLFVSFNSDKLNPIPVATGFITVRLAIYLSTWLKKK